MCDLTACVSVTVSSSALDSKLSSVCESKECRRYDAGCTDITNIDFSRTVIKEMLLKNLRKRPNMKWLVQDMTATKVRLPALAPRRPLPTRRCRHLPLLTKMPHMKTKCASDCYPC
jgi:hypothetical protein